MFNIAYPLSITTIEELADNNYEFDENGRKFSKWVENTMRQGEVACKLFTKRQNFGPN